MAIRVGMVSLGCPKNQVDAEHMLYNLREEGYEIEPDAALAEVVIINTCGFIESAKQEAIDTILELVTLKNEGRIKSIIVTGCLSERYRDEISKEIPEVDAVLGLGANELLGEIIKRGVFRREGELLRGQVLAGDRLEEDNIHRDLRLHKNSRGLLKPLHLLRYTLHQGKVPLEKNGKRH